MKKILSFTGTIIFGLVICMTIIAYVIFITSPKKSYGSVDSQTAGYYSTTTPYAGQINGVGGVVLLYGSTSPRSGILGSIIITGGPKAGTITLYDATTSNVNLRTGNLSTSTITLAEIPAGSATTTFVFDSNFNNGLLLVTSGSVPTTTITWK